MNLISSEEQKLIISDLDKGLNVKCIASPGSGKTTTILLACTSLQKPSLVLSYNRKIVLDIREKLKSNSLYVQIETFHSYATKIFKKSISDDYSLTKTLSNDNVPKIKYYFEIIYIDEAQDMTIDYCKFINIIIEHNSFKDCQLIFIGDPRQSIYNFAGSSSEFLEAPEKYFSRTFEGKSFTRTFTERSLSKSFRLTNCMTTFLNTHFLKYPTTEIVPKNNDVSKPVEIMEYWKIIDIIPKILNKIEEYGSADNITLLFASTGKKLAKEIAAQLTFKNILIHSANNSDNVDIKFTENKLCFSTFHQYKGLENKCIFLFNFDENYYNYYNRGGSVDNNALYVALSRASEELILVKFKYANPLPDINRPLLLEQEINGIVKSNSRIWKNNLTILSKANSEIAYNVTDIIKFLPINVITEIMKDVEIETTYFPGINIPREFCGQNYKEDVSFIYGEAISIIFEYLTYGKIYKMEMIIDDHRFKKVPSELYFKKDKVLPILKNAITVYDMVKKDPDTLENKVRKYCKELFLIITICHSWFSNFYIINQIKNYNWVDEYFIDYVIDKFKEIEGAEYELYYKVGFSDFSYVADTLSRHVTTEKPIMIKGFVDGIRENILYEFKFTSRDSIDHIIQSICYANICSRNIDTIEIINYWTGTKRSIKYNKNNTTIQKILYTKFLS